MNKGRNVRALSGTGTSDRKENVYLVRSCCAGIQLDVTAAILTVALFVATPPVPQRASKLSGVNKLDWVVSRAFSANAEPRTAPYLTVDTRMFFETV